MFVAQLLLSIFAHVDRYFHLAQVALSDDQLPRSFWTRVESKDLRRTVDSDALGSQCLVDRHRVFEVESWVGHSGFVDALDEQARLEEILNVILLQSKPEWSPSWCCTPTSRFWTSRTLISNGFF